MTSTRPHIHEVSDLLLDFAVSLMGAGTHTSHIALPIFLFHKRSYMMTRLFRPKLRDKARVAR